MVTMTRNQGVVNTFVVFLSRIVGYVVDKQINKDGNGQAIRRAARRPAAETVHSDGSEPDALGWSQWLRNRARRDQRHRTSSVRQRHCARPQALGDFPLRCPAASRDADPPPLTGLCTTLVQATSLASLVGVNEFFRINQIVVERTTMQTGHSPAFMVYGFALIVYFVVCSALTRLSQYFARRLQRTGTSSVTMPRSFKEVA